MDKTTIPDARMIPGKLPSVRALARKWAEFNGLVPTKEALEIIPGAFLDPEEIVEYRCQDAARRAIYHGKMQIETLPALRPAVRDANEYIAELSQLALRFSHLDKGDLAKGFAHFMGEPETETIGYKEFIAQTMLTTMQENAQLLVSSIDRFYGFFNARPVAPQNRRLAWFFIHQMASQYRDMFDRPTPRGNTGPFVELVAAAWTDLGWPVPRDRTGHTHNVADWLGTQIEKHPGVTENGPPK